MISRAGPETNSYADSIPAVKPEVHLFRRAFFGFTTSTVALVGLALLAASV
jgi:hypothetical protein